MNSLITHEDVMNAIGDLLEQSRGKKLPPSSQNVKLIDVNVIEDPFLKKICAAKNKITLANNKKVSSVKPKYLLSG